MSAIQLLLCNSRPHPEPSAAAGGINWTARAAIGASDARLIAAGRLRWRRDGPAVAATAASKSHCNESGFVRTLSSMASLVQTDVLPAHVVRVSD